MYVYIWVYTPIEIKMMWYKFAEPIKEERNRNREVFIWQPRSNESYCLPPSGVYWVMVSERKEKNSQLRRDPLNPPHHFGTWVHTKIRTIAQTGRERKSKRGGPPEVPISPINQVLWFTIERSDHNLVHIEL